MAHLGICFTVEKEEYNETFEWLYAAEGAAKATRNGRIVLIVGEGKLPSWAVNKVTHFVAPRVIKRIAKACHGYEAWKRSHRPEFKPWLFPEQCELPRLNWSDVPAAPDIDLTPEVVVDESQVADVNGNSMDKDDD
ncbi:unnamed protein product [Echinostoma caproni]|uniref:STAS/SEC14 domain-containing protein n=1 Tax=Echinostoma caproni TaxID=27848 RepID=A0A183AJV5_9TREM|nr:unnamed protein product [Echinostoma caproni]